MSSANEIYNSILFFGYNETLAKFMTAQSAHETNGWTSPIFKSNKNAFGMKYAGQSAALGEKNGYANYLNVQQSSLDLTKWYNSHRNSLLSLPLYIGSISSYVKFLKNNNYFEASEAEYLKGVTYWYNNLFI